MHSALDAAKATFANAAAPMSDDGWPESLPLCREMPPADPYPLDALGDLLGPAARAITSSVQCPDAIVGSSLLAASALAVQPFATAIIDGRKSPLSLFFTTIAESGERKSSVDRLATRPHRVWAERERDAYANSMKDWRAASEAYKQIHDSTARKKKSQIELAELLRELGDPPAKPLAPIQFTEEPTLEGLIKLIAAERPSLGLFSDEAGRFLGGHAMNPDNVLKTSAGLSKFWDGDAITRTRSLDGNTVLYGRRLSMHLMIQPTIAPLLYANDAVVGQGLLSRMLPAFPTSRIGTRVYSDGDATEAPEFRNYDDGITRLLNMALPMRAGTRNTLDPRLISLAPDARTSYVGFSNHVEGLCAAGRELEPIRGFAAKAPEHAARIGGVLALIRDPAAATIGATEIGSAIELVQYYIGETLRLHEIAAADPDLLLAARTLDWAQTRGRFAVTTLYQRGPRGVRDKAGAERVLKILFEHGRIRPLPAGSVVDGKPRKCAWETRPA